MNINDLIKNRKYRIKGNSPYFREKYGNSNPLFRYELTDIDAWGRSWAEMNGNPCALHFTRRIIEEKLAFDENDRVCYGQICKNDNIYLSELVHPSELEEIL